MDVFVGNPVLTSWLVTFCGTDFRLPNGRKHFGRQKTSELCPTWNSTYLARICKRRATV